MNPYELLPRLNALFGPEIADTLTQLMLRHKVQGERAVFVPSHILTRLVEVACRVAESESHG